jgi:hypothetical protein
MEAGLAELVAMAREQLLWQRAASVPIVRAALDEALPTTKMRKAYELCDGEHTFRDIATTVGVSLGAISGWSKKWRESGLAFEDAAGRMRHLASLEALGLPVDVDGVAGHAGKAREGKRRDNK